MTNYERLFGTPELVAETLISATKSCRLGRCDECPFFVNGCIRTSQTGIAAYLRKEADDALHSQSD